LALGALVAADTAIGSAAPYTTAQSIDRDHPNRVERVLVLSGGGARGAYEAGIIDYLTQAAGVKDGQPLAPYGFVCGTSIGALNGYFVATAQYSRLRELWYTVASSGAVRIKPQYAKIRNANAGVATRLSQAVDLAIGLTDDVTGVIDGARVRAYLAAQVDPSAPVVLPFAWTVTNLTRHAPEYFYLAPETINPELHEKASTALQTIVGPSAVLRPATPDLLVDSLQASAAIPIAFDPVVLPAADGSGPQQYCDGGVTENTPIGIARAAAKNVDVVMVDPPFESEHYRNAVQTGLASFGTLQRVLLEANVRGAYFESLCKLAIEQARPDPMLADVAKRLYASEFYLMRPRKVLAVSVAGFDDSDALYQTYKTGFQDARTGFTRLDLGQLQLRA
jgi:predicted acylesterase/phospholipase RssA